MALHKDHFDILYVRFYEGHVGPYEGYGDVWVIHVIAVHDKGLEMSSFHLALHKDHFDILYVRFCGGHVGPDEGFGDVWDIHASVVLDRGLEMSF